MPFRRSSLVLAAAILALGAGSAGAAPWLLADLDTGQVLNHEEATRPWYPASLTKLMTAYVVLEAIRTGRVTPDTPLTYSARAQGEPPSKMGFKVGQVVTVDNALKMMLVKSANDVSVMLAEGIGGSVEGFVAEMNTTARRLGMASTVFVNPNGLPGPGQQTTARDLALLAKAIYDQHPAHARYFGLQSIKLGKRVIRGYNMLIGRYPGADGMKTGFICSSGFNIVATARRGNRHLIAVVLGANSARERAEKAAELFEEGFGASWLSNLRRGPPLQQLAASGYDTPVDMREAICSAEARRNRREVASEAESADAAGEGNEGLGALAAVLNTEAPKPVLQEAMVRMEPEPVFVGPNPKKPTQPAPRVPAYAAGQRPGSDSSLALTTPGVVAVQPPVVAAMAAQTRGTKGAKPIALVPLPRPKPVD